MGSEATKAVFRVSDEVSLKPVSSATETSYKIEISHVATLDIRSKIRITKALFSLHFCCSQTPKTGFLALRPKLYASSEGFGITAHLLRFA